MGRFYTVPFARVADTVGTDLFEIISGSGKPFRIHEIGVGQTSDFGDAQAEGLLIELYRASGSYQTGSGGTTPTPSKHQTSDTAFGGTAKCNNTVLAFASAGALTLIRPEPFNVQTGYQYLPTPECRIDFMPTEAAIVRLTSGVGTAGPADSLTLSGFAVVEEFG